MKEFLAKRTSWIVAAGVITLCLLVLYVAVQQTLRLGANEPQRSMVADIARKLKDGTKPEEVITGHVDMATNMAPFVIVYDSFGNVITGNGELEGKVPQVPVGVLQSSNESKQNAVSWQPKNDVRIAAVTQKSGGNYVLVGRSIVKLENFLSNVFVPIVAMVWLVSMLLLGLGFWNFRRVAGQGQPLVKEQVTD